MTRFGKASHRPHTVLKLRAMKKILVSGGRAAVRRGLGLRLPQKDQRIANDAQSTAYSLAPLLSNLTGDLYRL